jgi:glycosyltransferase involved in cell wall biosynthesis
MTKKYWLKKDSRKSGRSTPPLTFDWIFIGNEHPIKGIDILEYLLMRSLGKFKVGVIGKLPKLAEKFELLDSPMFLGEVKGREKARIILCSGLVVLPSYHESFSMVACEALSLHTPVIAFNMPTLRSIYNKGMQFVPYGNQFAMFEKIDELLYDQDKYFEICNSMDYRFRWKDSARRVLCNE